MKILTKTLVATLTFILLSTGYSFAERSKNSEYEKWGKFNQVKPTMSEQMATMHSNTGRMLQGIKWMHSNIRAMQKDVKDKEVKNLLKKMDGEIVAINDDMESVRKSMKKAKDFMNKNNKK